MEPETLTCYCNCKWLLGSFENAWTAGKERPGVPNTVVEHSTLMDLVCQNCEKIVGFRCVDAPVSHTLRRHQNILMLKVMMVISDRTGSSAVIKPPVKTIALKSNDSLQKPLYVSGNVYLDSPPASDDQPDQYIERSVKDALKDQRAEIDVVGRVVRRIELDMQTFKDFMTECRGILKSLLVYQNQEAEQSRSNISREEQNQFSTIEDDSYNHTYDKTAEGLDMVAQDAYRKGDEANKTANSETEDWSTGQRTQTIESASISSSKGFRVNGSSDVGDQCSAFRHQKGRSPVQPSPTFLRRDLGDQHHNEKTSARPARQVESTPGPAFPREAAFEHSPSLPAYTRPKKPKDAVSNVHSEPCLQYCDHNVAENMARPERHVNLSGKAETAMGREVESLSQLVQHRPPSSSKKRKSRLVDSGLEESKAASKYPNKRQRISDMPSNLKDPAMGDNTPQQHFRFDCPDLDCRPTELPTTQTPLSPSPTLGSCENDGRIILPSNEYGNFQEHQAHDEVENESAYISPPALTTLAPQTRKLRPRRARAASNAEMASSMVVQGSQPKVVLRSLRSRSSLGGIGAESNNKDAGTGVDGEKNQENAEEKNTDACTHNQQETTHKDAEAWVDPSKLQIRKDSGRGGHCGPNGRRRRKTREPWGLPAPRKSVAKSEHKVNGKEVDGVNVRRYGETSHTEDGEEAREKVLAAREQLVRKTLEREHFGIALPMSNY